MHRSDDSPFRHTYNFVPNFSGAERRTRIVIGITAVMMVLEIAVGPCLAFDGFAGRWLAHEYSCDRVSYYRNGLLSNRYCLSWIACEFELRILLKDDSHHHHHDGHGHAADTIMI